MCYVYVMCIIFYVYHVLQFNLSYSTVICCYLLNIMLRVFFSGKFHWPNEVKLKKHIQYGGNSTCSAFGIWWKNLNTFQRVAIISFCKVSVTLFLPKFAIKDLSVATMAVSLIIQISFE